MPKAPLIVSYADQKEREHIAQWLQDPAYYDEAFFLPIRPDPAWVKGGFLLIDNPNGQELLSVRFWVIKEANGHNLSLDPNCPMLGFAIDYPADVHTSNIREVDFALPNLKVHSSKIPFEIMGWLAHAVIQKGNPILLKTRIISSTGRGFPRMFARIGAEQSRQSGMHLADPRYKTRVEYQMTPEMFYNSYWAKRNNLGISEKP